MKQITTSPQNGKYETLDSLFGPKDDPIQFPNDPGYESYPAEDDIYNKSVETDEDPTDSEDIDNLLDNDLDVPGSELDNAQEDIGSEDEENNYYSIGGDNHDDLDESNDDLMNQ